MAVARVFIFFLIFLANANAPSTAERAPRKAAELELSKNINEIDLDRDCDGLDDDGELALAQGFVPYLVWSKFEKCSLHQTFWQVHPLDSSHLSIMWTFTFPLDCGYRSKGIDAHWGDTETYGMIVIRVAERTWRILDFNGNSPAELRFYGNSHPVLYLSAGKHHGYLTFAECARGHFGFEGCGGGRQGIAAVDGRHNVGEAVCPLITTLDDFGQGPYADNYKHENAWYQSGWGDWFFNGGHPKRDSRVGAMGPRWKGLKN